MQHLTLKAREHIVVLKHVGNISNFVHGIEDKYCLPLSHHAAEQLLMSELQTSFKELAEILPAMANIDKNFMKQLKSILNVINILKLHRICLATEEGEGKLIVHEQR